MTRYFLACLLLACGLAKAQNVSLEISYVEGSFKQYCHQMLTSCLDDRNGINVGLKSSPSTLPFSPALAIRYGTSLSVVNGFERTVSPPVAALPPGTRAREQMSAYRMTLGVEVSMVDRVVTPTLGIGLSAVRFSRTDTVEGRPDIRLKQRETNVRPYLAIGANVRLSDQLALVGRVSYASHDYGSIASLKRTSEVGVQYSFLGW